MPIIVFIINEDGTVVNEVFGSVGKECDKLTKPYNEILGGKVKTIKYKENAPQEQTIEIE